MTTGQLVSLVRFTKLYFFNDFGDEILQAFLPPDLRERSPTGFAMTGHIGVLLADSFVCCS